MNWNKPGILLLEDNPMDVKVITSFIRNAGIDGSFTIVKTRSDFEEAMYGKRFDIILSDHQLEDFSSIDALDLRNQIMPDVPFILITSTISEMFALEIIKQGATDYIFKSNLQRLPLAIRHAIELSETEKAYKLIRQRFELATRASVNVIWDYDLVEDSIYLSEAAKDMIGVNDYIQNPARLITYIHNDDKKRVVTAISDVINSGEISWKEVFRIKRIDGTIRHLTARALILRNHEKAVRIVGVLQDITDMTHLQHQLLVQELKKQKEISRISIKAQEKEREEIGKELHDNVNQLLAVAKIMLDSAKKSPEHTAAFIEKSQNLIMEAITEIRNISHAMIPPSFEQNHFKDNLQDLAYNINISQKLNFQLYLPSDKDMEAVDDDRKLAIYRIVQEQLTNILKYSKAMTAIVSVELKDNLVVLTIRDDGIGFDTELKKKGIGLKNIEKRAEYFEGRMMIDSEPGKGCKLKVQIPVN